MLCLFIVLPVPTLDGRFMFCFQFEWAWQNPKISRRLKHLPPKGRTEKVYDYCIRVLSEMLNVGPWNRLALNVRWLNVAYRRDFSVRKLIINRL